MAAFSTRKIADYFKRSDAAKTAAAKGKELEDLTVYLFEKIPGVSLSARNVKSVFDDEEIDVAFFNDQSPAGLRFLNFFLLVECKNWSKPVGSMEMAWFAWKVESRHLDFGILIAANGITGNAADGKEAHKIASSALEHGRRLIVVTRAEILALRTTEDLVTLIKRKLLQLVASGTVWP
jgi:hypothetical protein